MNDPWTQVAEAPAGTLHVSEPLPLPRLDDARELIAWLPSGDPPDDGWPLVVFHDGQNLFAEHAAIDETWRLGDSLGLLARDGRPVVAVGVPHGGERRRVELSPFRTDGRGVDYVADLVDSVLPAVRGTLPVSADRTATFLAGSSLGGLVSIYAAYAHPSVFGGCAALSPALAVGNEGVWDWLEGQPRPEARIYIDVGGMEVSEERARLLHTSSEHYSDRVRRLHRLLERHGFRDGVDLCYVEDADGRHHETAWARRIGPALEFVLAGGRPG